MAEAGLRSIRLGNYELVRRLAQGGMADIYLARRVGPGQFERHVVVKVLHDHRSDDAEACAMFLDEARVVAMLNHHNIASVLEVDVIDGHYFLVMELVHGVDLRRLLAVARDNESPLPYEASLAIVCGAAAGLDHAHRRCGPDGAPLELVHRDVSPSNIMVGHDGSVKVIDFGIATSKLASVHTSPGVVRGKASYMSPEQCVGDPVDHRSDVFALGVVLYELTTGVRCFHGGSDFERMLAVVRNDYAAPGDLDPSYPGDLEQVIRRALAPDPAQRFGSAAAMVEELERVAAAHGWTTGPGGIQRVMRSLFGQCAEPWALHTDDAPVTERALAVLPFAIEPTRPHRPTAFTSNLDELACRLDGDLESRDATRGEATAPALPAQRGREGPPWIDDLDERTRGRSPLRRSSRPRLAA